MKDEGKDTIEFLDELFNGAKLLIEMQEDFTVRTRFKLETIFLFKILEVVNLSVSNQG